MTDMPSGQITVALPGVWVGIEELPILFANQFVLQAAHADEAYLALGVVTPPFVLGTPEQQLAQIEQLTYLPVTPVARLALTRRGVQELAAVLQRMIDTFPDQAGKERAE